MSVETLSPQNTETPASNPLERNQFILEESTPDLSEIQERLQKSHPEWPKIPRLELSFYLAYHGNVHDTLDAPEALKDVDVFLYESVSPNYETRKSASFVHKMYNEASIAPYYTFDRLLRQTGDQGTSMENFVRGFYDTKKIVTSIDIGDDEYEQELARNLKVDEISRGQPSFGAAMTLFRDNLAKFAGLQQKREVMIVGKFENQIEHVIEFIMSRRPDLATRDSLKIMISMGAAHTTLQDAFRDAGMDSSTWSSKVQNMTFSHAVEATRALQDGKEPSEDLLKRAFTEKVIAQSLRKLVNTKDLPGVEYDIYLRRLVSHLDDDSMSQLFELWNDRKNTGRNINAVLETVGIPVLPMSAGEILESNKVYSKMHRRQIGKSALSNLPDAIENHSY